MVEIIGIIASVLGIIAFFAVAPKDLAKSFKGWFVEPVATVTKQRKRLNIKEVFDLLEVDDVRIENVFVSKPLMNDSFDSEVIDYQGRLPDEIDKLKAKEISEKKELAEKRGMTFDNNASFALRRIDVSRLEGENGKRKNVYKLILEPTDYYSFIFPNLSLDKKYHNEVTQENHSLRDLLNLNKESLSLSTLVDHPECQFKVGTGTLLVTNDNYLVCSVRSKSQFVASKRNSNELAVHLSCAEGMYRSRNVTSSSDCIDGIKPSPFATSARSLIDELNLGENDFKINEILCLGYFFDLKRAQPFFLFYLKVDLSIDEFFSVYSNTSADIHENEAIFGLPNSFESISRLFKGGTFAEINAIFPKIYEDFFKANSSANVRLASNHAKAGFAAFAYKDLGPITENMI